MTRIWWPVVNLIARCLEREDRDAVCGDLQETGVSGPRTIEQIAGLVLRRMALAWMDWRPWLVLVTVVLPVGVLLSFITRSWADSAALDAFLYVENWTTAYLDSPGARRDLLAAASRTLVAGAALVAWSWGAGLAIASVSRRTSWATWTIFGIVVFVATVGTTTSARGPHNAAVLGTLFYGLVLPATVRVGLVLLPAWLAVRRHASRRLRWTHVAPVIVAAFVLTVWTARRVEGLLIFGSNGRIAKHDAGIDGFVGTVDDGRPLRLVPLLLAWPGVIVLVAAARPRRAADPIDVA